MTRVTTRAFLTSLALTTSFAACALAQEEPTSQPASQPAAELGAEAKAMLMDPSKATLKAPEKFRARFETTKGAFVIEVTRKWSPSGADRFYNLVKCGYFDGCKFFRVIREPQPFMAQFGINGDPKVNEKWLKATIKDDPPAGISNTRGRISFAKPTLPNNRTTQLFINYDNNERLDGMGFTPFGEVVEGMKVVDSLHAGYGEGAPRGRGPDQGQIQSRGNAYLEASFPRLDGIETARVVGDEAKGDKGADKPDEKEADKGAGEQQD